MPGNRTLDGGENGLDSRENWKPKSDHGSAIDSAWPRSRQMAGACWQFGSANYEILRPFLLNCVGP